CSRPAWLPLPRFRRQRRRTANGTFIGTISERFAWTRGAFTLSGTIAGRLGHGEGTAPAADCIHLLAHGAGVYDGGADAVKLLFLTVELERTERVDDLAGLHSPGGRALHH